MAGVLMAYDPLYGWMLVAFVLFFQLMRREYQFEERLKDLGREFEEREREKGVS